MRRSNAGVCGSVDGGGRGDPVGGPGVGVGGTTGENTEARSSPEAEGEGTTLLLFFLFSFR